MLKFGNICDVDPEAGLCRVEFDEDGITSDWLPLVVKNSFNTKDFFIFEIGEHVAALMDCNSENGVILGAIYSSDRKPNGGSADKRRTVYKDGSTFDFDMNNGTLTIDVKGDVIINAASTSITAAENTVRGPLVVEGKITAENGIDVTGSVEATADVKAGSISLLTHVHPGVSPGTGSTSTPI